MTFISEFVNADGLEQNTLDFTENADGDFEAVFDLWQVTYKENMKIWGWMDAPSEKFTFSTCDPDQGQQNNKYTNEYYYGTNYSDLLNFPSKYIFENDWVIQDPYTFHLNRCRRLPSGQPRGNGANGLPEWRRQRHS